MKTTHRFKLPFLIVAALALSVSCSTIKTVVNDPNTTAGAIVADCAKPEIADQIANALASVNQVLADSSKLQSVKEAEINALRAGRDEVIACALREGVSEITRMVRDAANKHAAIDSRLFDSRDTMNKLIDSNAFKYTDGWGTGNSPSGSGGAAGMSDGGSGGSFGG